MNQHGPGEIKLLMQLLLDSGSIARTINVPCTMYHVPCTMYHVPCNVEHSVLPLYDENERA